jgi:hypothetical protein
MNGREAREGDHIVWRTPSTWSTPGRKQKTFAGVIAELNPDVTSCDASIFYPKMGGMGQLCITVGECLHAEDAYDAYVLAGGSQGQAAPPPPLTPAAL